MPTKIINNFSGRLTRDNIGDMNSGLAKYQTTVGNDPFSNVGNLTWTADTFQFSSSVISDLIMAAKTRLESGITYVYAVGHTGRVYKIQVNDPASFNPNYDNPTLLTTLTINSPTFKYGSSIQFYGATEKLYIGHDLGVTSVKFDGTNETFVGALGSYTANVPRPSVNFLGKLYFGNGSNLVEVDSTETVTSYAKLSPGFPTGTYVRDLDVSPDGNYLQIIVSRLNSPDMTSTTQDTTSLSSADSYKFLWNGTDTGYTSYESFTGFTITSNQTFGSFTYTMGYDLNGAALYTGGAKILTLPDFVSPNFEAMFSTGNMLGFAAPETNAQGSGIMKASIMMYGQYDEEIPRGLFRVLSQHCGIVGGSVVQVPICLPVSNLFFGKTTTPGYSHNAVGLGKIYFSLLATDANGNPSYQFYNFPIMTTTLESIYSRQGGVYETQNESSFQLFRSIISKKFTVTQVRLYTEPLSDPSSQSFTINLIDSGGNIINGGSANFTGPATGTQDYFWYTPQIAPQYSVGVQIQNTGLNNWVGVKLELDYEEAGQ